MNHQGWEKHGGRRLKDGALSDSQSDDGWDACIGSMLGDEVGFVSFVSYVSDEVEPRNGVTGRRESIRGLRQRESNFSILHTYAPVTYLA